MSSGNIRHRIRPGDLYCMPSRLLVRQHRDDHAAGVQHRVLLSRGSRLVSELPVRDMELLDGGIILWYVPRGLCVYFERGAAMPAGVLLAGRPDRVPAVSHWDVRQCPGFVVVHWVPGWVRVLDGPEQPAGVLAGTLLDGWPAGLHLLCSGDVQQYPRGDWLLPMRSGMVQCTRPLRFFLS